MDMDFDNKDQDCIFKQIENELMLAHLLSLDGMLNDVVYLSDQKSLSHKKDSHPDRL